MGRGKPTCFPVERADTKVCPYTVCFYPTALKPVPARYHNRVRTYAVVARSKGFLRLNPVCQHPFASPKLYLIGCFRYEDGCLADLKVFHFIVPLTFLSENLCLCFKAIYLLASSISAREQQTNSTQICGWRSRSAVTPRLLQDNNWFLSPMPSKPTKMATSSFG